MAGKRKERRIYFISGHLDLTPIEFIHHYVKRIDAAVAEKAEFIVCDARGCDLMAQQYLAGLGCRATIFHMLKEPRNNVHPVKQSLMESILHDGGWRGPPFATWGGFKSDEDRDAACTESSTHDIAWVRPGRENSGTARNLARRAKKNDKWLEELEIDGGN